MAAEIEIPYTTTAVTLYAQVRNSVGQIWRTDTNVFESYSTANIANYAITMTEQGTASKFYTGTFPTAITIGAYNVVAFLRSGGSPAEADTPVGIEKFNWNGTAVHTLGDTRQFAGTGFTDTSGRVAAAFSTMFNVVSPTLTARGIDQTGDSYARIGAAGASLTALGSATNLAAANTNISAIQTRVTTALPSTAPNAATGLPTTDILFRGIAKAGSVVHVAKSGNDTTGDGSFLLPYLTLDKANTVAGYGATIWVWPCVNATTPYAESIESSADVEWYLTRGAIVAPSSGDAFLIDTTGVSIRGDGSITAPASGVAIHVTDGFLDVSGVTLTVNATSSVAVFSGSSAPVVLSNLRVVGASGTTTNPQNFFTTEDADTRRISLVDVQVSYTSAAVKQIVSTGYGYAGNWSLTTSLGAVGGVNGDVAQKILGGGSSTITGTGVRSDLRLIAGQTVTCSGGVTIPAATLASTTNITAGTLTTVTTAANVTTVNGLAANVITAASIAVDADAEIAAAVWDLATAGHTTSGTFGAAMNAAGSAGDPWGTSLPGAYGAGTAGFIVGTNLNGTVTSRMATYTQPTGFLSATFPGGTIANTTNITAGTIATVTGAVGSVAANVGGNVIGSVGSVATGGIVTASFGAGATIPRVTLADSLTTNNDKTGYSLNLAQLIGNTQTIGTVGDALLASEAEGFGKWTIVGTALTIYRHDGLTVARIFVLDSATTPTSRT